MIKPGDILIFLEMFMTLLEFLIGWETSNNTGRISQNFIGYFPVRWVWKIGLSSAWKEEVGVFL